MRKTVDEAEELLEETVSNSCLWTMDRSRHHTTLHEQKGALAIDPIMDMQAKIDNLTRQLNNMKASSSAPVKSIQQRYELCGQSHHDNIDCFLMKDHESKQVNYMGA